MRRLSLLLAVLFVMPLFGYDSPKEYDGSMEAVGIEGTWQRVEVEWNGEKGKPKNECVMTLRGGTYTDKYNVGEARGNYRCDATQKPRHFDRIQSSGVWRGMTEKWIYQIDGDMLRIAMKPAEQYETRAAAFNDKGVYVLTYKRVK